MHPRNRRRAVTLVESTVVFAALAVAGGLALPGIQTARDKAARTQAADVMRRLTQATHAYAGQHAGQLLDYTGLPPQAGVSIIDYYRPHLGAVPLQRLPYLRLPSDPSGEPDLSKLGPSPNGAGFLIEPCSFGFNGVCYASGVRLDRSFTDGLSNTIGLAEHYGICGKTTFEAHIQGGSASIINGEVVYETSHNPPMRRVTFADFPKYDDVYPVTKTDGVRPLTVGSKPLTFQQQPAPADCNYRIPQSSLPGGLSVGFLDGSVKVFKPQTAPEVFWGSVTPAGGESVNLD